MASATRLGGEADDVLDAANIAGDLTEDDARTFGLLQAWRDERLLTPVELALVRVALTSLYRDRTGSATEHQTAMEQLRVALEVDPKHGMLL